MMGAAGLNTVRTYSTPHRDRSPKPALEAVAELAERDLAGLRTRWPAVSVVVCGYNVEAVLLWHLVR